MIFYSLLFGCTPQGTTTVTSLTEETNIATNIGENKTVALPFHTVVGRDSNKVISLKFSARLLDGLQKPTLLTSRAGTNVQVFLDNEWVYGQSFRTDPMAHTWNTPQLVAFSKAQLNNAEFVRIILFAFAGDHTLLDPIYLGENDKLVELHDRFRFFQNDLTLAIVVATLVLLSVSILLWFASGGDKIYTMVIVCSATLMVACQNYFVVNSYLSHALLQAVTHSSLDWFGVFVALWIMHIKALTNKYNPLLYGWGLLCTLINIVLPANWIVPFVEWLHFVTIGGVLLVLMAPVKSQSANASEITITRITGGTGCCLSLIDLLIQLRFIQAPGLPRIVPILFFAIFISNFALLLNRFTRTYKIARRSQKELELIVSSREAQIDKKYAMQTRQDTELARTSERNRIMREIHDSMGGHLVSALAVAEHDDQINKHSKQRIKETLTVALGEMRLLLSNSSGDSQDLGDALGSLRMHLDPLLLQAGIKLLWKIDPLGTMPILTLSERMHVIRIIQECITNVIKHTQATEVTVTTRRSDTNYIVQVKDNGSDSIADNIGHGMSNMSFRAGELGGVFTIEKIQTETVATLLFPFERS